MKKPLNKIILLLDGSELSVSLLVLAEVLFSLVQQILNDASRATCARLERGIVELDADLKKNDFIFQSFYFS